MNNPLVSIIIPVYNGSNYVKEAIDSALAQTYKNIEIIVVNDGSKDDGATEQIALSYGDKIRYFAKENGGVSTALNLGIEKMQGEYFSWLSHDDAYTPNKVEDQIKELKNIPQDKLDSTILMCDSSFIDGNSKPLKRNQKKIKAGYYTNVEMFNQIFSGYSIGGCALLIPKKLFENLGKFREDLRYMQDMELWYRFFIGGTNLYYSNTQGVLSRVHGAQVTVTGKHMGREDAVKVGSYMVDNLADMYYKKVNLLKKYMYLCYKRNSLETAQKAYLKLKEMKKINLFTQIKIFFVKLFGQIRPALVKAYYKIFFGIKVK